METEKRRLEADRPVYGVLEPAPEGRSNFEPIGRAATWPFRPEVHQAAGMVSVQLGCSVDEAMRALLDRAAVIGQPPEELARAVVTRRAQFVPPTDP